MCRDCVSFSPRMGSHHHHHHHPCRSCSGVCGVSPSMADLFWAGFCAISGCSAWGFNAVERGRQCGIGTGYFNGIEATQSSLSAQFPRAPCPGSWESCGDNGWNLFLQYVTARSWGLCPNTLKLLWKTGKKKESVPHRERLQLSRQAAALLGGTAGH